MCLANKVAVRFCTKGSRINMKNAIANGAIIGLSASLLWHFSNIWRYGQHLIQEPNIAILSLETAGLLLILIFGISKCISDLKRKEG